MGRSLWIGAIATRTEQEIRTLVLRSVFRGNLQMSGRAVVAMVQAAQSHMRNHLTGYCRADSAARCFFVQTKMGSVFMVQVDNLIPIVLSREKSVIRGIRGMGVRSGFIEHL
jgi:hypothetical protein